MIVVSYIVAAFGLLMPCILTWCLFWEICRRRDAGPDGRPVLVDASAVYQSIFFLMVGSNLLLAGVGALVLTHRLQIHG